MSDQSIAARSSSACSGEHMPSSRAIASSICSRSVVSGSTAGDGRWKGASRSKLGRGREERVHVALEGLRVRAREETALHGAALVDDLGGRGHDRVHLIPGRGLVLRR
jgi:hypothetical protein